MESLGKKLREERKKRNLSMLDLAESINISQSNLSKIENDMVKPSTETLKKLCETLNITSDYLLFGNNTKLEIDEQKMLNGFRALNERRKGALEDKLKDLLKDQEQENIIKQEIS